MPINYKVINITFQIDGFFDLMWKKFETQTTNLNFVVTYLNEIKLIHGLECFETSGVGAHIIRRDSDVLITDEKWKYATILPLKERGHVNSFFASFFTPMPSSATLFISTVP